MTTHDTPGWFWRWWLPGFLTGIAASGIVWIIALILGAKP